MRKLTVAERQMFEDATKGHGFTAENPLVVSRTMMKHCKTLGLDVSCLSEAHFYSPRMAAPKSDPNSFAWNSGHKVGIDTGRREMQRDMLLSLIGKRDKLAYSGKGLEHIRMALFIDQFKKHFPNAAASVDKMVLGEKE